MSEFETPERCSDCPQLCDIQTRINNAHAAQIKILNGAMAVQDTIRVDYTEEGMSAGAIDEILASEEM